ncbi:hypothetical protein SCHPADRAFT_456764 [Schizopora paradoxa]|uniref:Uncharacterized protein n=1 Tax=Schizopora paradoxa TaxID=27342 RepID=A0A0H2RID6_9AGAM|nr:hypothetical protein SCHPADRAFT_456764 [Schizopora paradoxa]
MLREVRVFALSQSLIAYSPTPISVFLDRSCLSSLPSIIRWGTTRDCSYPCPAALGSPLNFLRSCGIFVFFVTILIHLVTAARTL